MAGSKRYKDGAWRLRVHIAFDRYAHATVRAPNNRTGAKQADLALANLALQVAAGHHNTGPAITMEELLERWQQTRSHSWSPKTAEDYARNIRLHITPALGHIRIDRLRPHDLDRFYATKHQTMAGASVYQLHAICSAALNQAVRWGHIARNPATDANTPKATATEIQPPPPQAVAALLADLQDDPATNAFIRLAAATGARRGELCALRWTDLDLAGAQVTIRRGLIHANKQVIEQGPKTGGRRPVAIGPTTVKVLHTWRTALLERCVRRYGISAPEWVFPADTDPRLPVRPDVMTARWRRLRARHGLEGARLHDLRHWSITSLLGEGVDAKTVQHRVGHHSAKMTLDLYGHLIPANDREAAVLLDALLDGTG